MNGTRSFSSPALLPVALSFSACETAGPLAPDAVVRTAPAASLAALSPSNTIEVTAPGDAGSGGCTPEECTLREAVAAAAAAEGAHRITFSPALATRTIVLDGAPLVIDSDILFDGSGGGFTVDADGRSRVLEIPPGVTVEIVRGTITGGSSVVNGGGIENLGSLTLVDSTIYGNAATGAGAAGGGIYSEGGLVLSISTVAGNSATEGGGLYLFATGASISNSVLGGNTGGDCAQFFGSVADGG